MSSHQTDRQDRRADDHAGRGSGAEPDAIEFFWRPGCPFCSMLERDLVGSGIPMVRHNIWDEPAAAEIVRSVAGGNETVPTVRVGDRALVNPSIAEVAELVAEVAPAILPAHDPHRP
jgi:glutaredoxin